MKDPYILENGTLKNKLGITDYDRLKEAECDIGFVKLMSLDSIDDNCDGITLVKRIHNHIFSDIFDWAGEYRTIPIEKAEALVIPGLSLKYGEPKFIKTEMEACLKTMYEEKWDASNLADFSQKLTKYLTRMWKIHPFRDGNTRTTLAFARLFARQHGLNLNMGRVLKSLSREYDSKTGRPKTYSIRDLFVLASLDKDFGPEPEHLQALFKSTIEETKEKYEHEL